MAGTLCGGSARFSCPPNFTAMPPASECTRFSLEMLMNPDMELWLIQAPVDFTPDCFNGRLVPLSGSQTVKGKVAGKRHRYWVLSSSGPQAGEATLLAPSAEAGGGLSCAPAPKGSLRILEGPQESLSGIPLHPIPNSPPPQIPPGLRPRFCAFGGSPPVTGPGSALALRSPASGKRKKKRHALEAFASQEALDGRGAVEVDTVLGSSEVDVGKKKKKKKKQQPNELEVVKPVATEPTAETVEPLGVLLPSTIKKKKQPKGTDAGMPEPEDKAVELEVTVKTEPLQETVLPLTKKRKRQKGTEAMEPEVTEPVEGVGSESQVQVEEEPQEEANALLSSKKKKRKKYRVPMELGIQAVEPQVRPLEVQGEMMGPELQRGVEPQAEVALAPTRKRRQTDTWQNTAMEPETQVVELELPGDLEPQTALTSTKNKKERECKVTEPGTEMTGPQGTVLDHEARADPAPTKKRRKRCQERGRPEAVFQEMVELPQDLESGEAASVRWEKRKKLQLEPA